MATVKVHRGGVPRTAETHAIEFLLRTRRGTLAEIAAEFGISRQRVHEMARRLGIEHYQALSHLDRRVPPR